MDATEAPHIMLVRFLLVGCAALIGDEDLHLCETRKWRKLHTVQMDKIGLVYQCK